MLIKNKNSFVAGFTIVELLIVIVVIGLLAALVLNTFQGVQQRSRNTTLNSNMSKWINALVAYGIDNDEYPSTTSCLGSNYVNNSGLSDGQCRFAGSWGNAENVTFTDAMRPYIDTSQPPGTAVTVGSNGWLYVGGLYAHTAALTVDGASRPELIIYQLEGNSQECVTDGVLISGPWPAMNSISDPFSYNNGDHTACLLVLPPLPG